MKQVTVDTELETFASAALQPGIVHSEISMLVIDGEHTLIYKDSLQETSQRKI